MLHRHQFYEERPNYRRYCHISTSVRKSRTKYTENSLNSMNSAHQSSVTTSSSPCLSSSCFSSVTIASRIHVMFFLCTYLVLSYGRITYYVTAPERLRLNQPELLRVAVDNLSPNPASTEDDTRPDNVCEVTVYMTAGSGSDRDQLFGYSPGVRSTSGAFNKHRETFTSSGVRELRLLVEPKHLLDATGGDLLVNSVNLHVEVGDRRGQTNQTTVRRLTVEPDSSSVTIQLSKPVYRPGELVQMRFICIEDSGFWNQHEETLDSKTLSGQTKLCTTPFNVSLVNSRGITMHRFNGLSTNEKSLFNAGFIQKSFRLPDIPLYGVWLVKAFFGYAYMQTAVEKFTVEKYELPRFRSAIEVTPNAILRTTKSINITVTAIYDYGQPVRGSVFLTFGVVKQNDSPSNRPSGKDKEEVTGLFGHVEHLRPIRLENGKVSYRLLTSRIRRLGNQYWFCQWCSRLYVEARIRELSSDVVETISSKSAAFVPEPFQLDVVEPPLYFRQPLPYVIQVEVHYGIAASVCVDARFSIISAASTDTMNFSRRQDIGPGKRVLQFSFEAPMGVANKLTIDVFSCGNSLPEKMQTIRHFVAKPLSEKNAKETFIIYAQHSEFYVGRPATFYVFSSHSERNRTVHLNYLLHKEQGTIVHQAHLPSFQLGENFTVEITQNMQPQVYLIVYYVVNENGEDVIVSNRLLIRVIKRCSDFLRIETLQTEFRPKDKVVFYISSEANSVTGLRVHDIGLYERFIASQQNTEHMSNGLSSSADHRSATSGSSSHRERRFPDRRCRKGYHGNRDLIRRLLITNTPIRLPERHKSTNCQSVIYRSRRGQPDEFSVSENLSRDQIPMRSDQCCSMGASVDVNSVGDLEFDRDIKNPVNQSNDTKDQAQNEHWATLQERCVLAMGTTLTGPVLAECRQAFLDCCVLGLNRTGRSGRRGSQSGPVNTPAPRPGSSEYFYRFHDKPSRGDQVESALRWYFPDTWLFRDIYWQSGGTRRVMARLPDSITTWAISAILYSPRYGICQIGPKKITTVKPIHVKLSLPSEIVRFEQVEVGITIINYEATSQQVTVTVKSSANGLCQRGSRDSLTGSSQEEYQSNGGPVSKFLAQVGAKNTTIVSHSLLPMAVGEFWIQVNISGIISASDTRDHHRLLDGVNKTFNVLPPGLEKVKTRTFIIDPARKLMSSASSMDTDEADYRKRRNVVIDTKRQTNEPLIQAESTTALELKLPKNVVRGSDKTLLILSGDLLNIRGLVNGHISCFNLSTLLQIPAGCGEQTLIGLAPIVYTLNYLRSVGRDIDRRRRRHTKHVMQQGFERALTFRNPDDASYSIWYQYPPSTWLTAFVTKVTCQASAHIDVEPELVCRSLDWLMDRQRSSDGLFKEGFPVLNRQISGGGHDLTSISAFVLVTLYECRCDKRSTDDAERTMHRIRRVRRAALSTVRQKALLSNDPYNLVLAAYASALDSSAQSTPDNQSHNQTRALLDRLFDMSKLSEQGRFWEVKSARHLTAIRTKKNFAAEGVQAVELEMTAYALLAYLEYGHIERTHQIASWLLHQRNGRGSFISTQDTVVVLQALSRYGKFLASISSPNLTVSVSNALTGSVYSAVRITEQNATKAYQVAVPSGAPLRLHSKGSGIVQAQLETVYYEAPPSKSSFGRGSAAASSFKESRRKSGPDCQFDVEVRSEMLHGIPDIDDLPPLPDLSSLREAFSLNGSLSLNGFSGGKNNQLPPPNNRKSRADEPVLFGDTVHGDWQESPPGILKRSGRIGRSTREHIRVEVCIRYMGISSQTSGMVVVELTLFTGYTPIQTSLEQLVKNNPAVSFYELTERAVIIYMSPMASGANFSLGNSSESSTKTTHNKTRAQNPVKPVCLQVESRQTNSVGNTQPVPVRVYDYYEPSRRCIVFYNPKLEAATLSYLCEGEECTCQEGRCSDCLRADSFFSSSASSSVFSSSVSSYMSFSSSSSSSASSPSRVSGSVSLGRPRGPRNGVSVGDYFRLERAACASDLVLRLTARDWYAQLAGFGNFDIHIMNVEAVIQLRPPASSSEIFASGQNGAKNRPNVTSSAATSLTVNDLIILKKHVNCLCPELDENNSYLLLGNYTFSSAGLQTTKLHNRIYYSDYIYRDKLIVPWPNVNNPRLTPSERAFARNLLRLEKHIYCL